MVKEKDKGNVISIFKGSNLAKDESVKETSEKDKEDEIKLKVTKELKEDNAPPSIEMTVFQSTKLEKPDPNEKNESIKIEAGSGEAIDSNNEDIVKDNFTKPLVQENPTNPVDHENLASPKNQANPENLDNPKSSDSVEKHNNIPENQDKKEKKGEKGENKENKEKIEKEEKEEKQKNPSMLSNEPLVSTSTEVKKEDMTPINQDNEQPELFEIDNLDIFINKPKHSDNDK